VTPSMEPCETEDWTAEVLTTVPAPYLPFKTTLTTTTTATTPAEQLLFQNNLGKPVPGR